MRFLAEQAESASGPSDGESLAAACYSLKALHRGPDAQRLVAALARQVAHREVTFDSGKAIGNACYGLQSLGDSEGSRALALALADKVRESSAVLDAQHIGNACYGLQSLGDSEGSRALAQALAAKVREFKKPLDAQAIGNACYGLQSLGDSPETRALALAQALAGKIQAAGIRLTGQQLAMAFASTRGALAHLPLATQVAQALDDGMASLAPREVAMILSRLSLPDARAAATEPLLQALVAQALRGGLDRLDSVGLVSIVRSMHLLGATGLIGADRKGDSLDGSLLRRYEDQLEVLLAQVRPSALEAAVQARVLGQAFRLQGVRPMVNMLIDGIEMDLYLHGDAGALNIEIDGPSHSGPTQRLADQVRDAYLADQGIRVVRINADALDFDVDRICAAAMEHIHAFAPREQGRAAEPAVAAVRPGSRVK